MVKILSALLLFMVITGCSIPNKTPVEEDFEVQVQVVEQTPKSTEEIEIETVLINKSEESYQIQHAAPLIHLQIIDEYDHPLIDSFHTLTIGIAYKIRPKEVYNPDSKNHNNGKRTINIEKPGKYKLIGTASFSVQVSDTENKEFKVVSQAREIIVE